MNNCLTSRLLKPLKLVTGAAALIVCSLSGATAKADDFFVSDSGLGLVRQFDANGTLSNTKEGVLRFPRGAAGKNGGIGVGLVEVYNVK